MINDCIKIDILPICFWNEKKFVIALLVLFRLEFGFGFLLVAISPCRLAMMQIKEEFCISVKCNHFFPYF